MLQKTELKNRILSELPSLKALYGKPGRVHFAKRLGVPFEEVKEAFRQINLDQTAFIHRDRETGGTYICDTQTPDPSVCPMCGSSFEQPKWRKKTCSRTCGARLTWERPGVREAIAAGNSRTKSKPEYTSKLSEASKKRWQDPNYRKKIFDSNQEMWATRKEELSAKISAAKSTPERREKYRENFKKQAQTKIFQDNLAATRISKRYKRLQKEGCKRSAAEPKNRERLVRHCKKLGKLNHQRAMKRRARRRRQTSHGEASHGQQQQA